MRSRRPSQVSVLQLDTHFPRLPGDVACGETYCRPPEILRIARADVAHIVYQNPEAIDIEPFIAAARRSQGDIITTSCGFLSPFEDIIAAQIDRPFLASSLNALPYLLAPVVGDWAINSQQELPGVFQGELRGAFQGDCRGGWDADRQNKSRGDWPKDWRGDVRGDQINIMSFDRSALSHQHLPPGALAHLGQIFDIGQKSHLYQVLSQDRTVLNADIARREVVSAVDRHLTDDCRLLVLECTNLPPHKQAIRAARSIQTFDILDRIEAVAPGSINSGFL